MAIRRRTIVLLATLVVLLVIAGVLASIFIDPDRCRPQVISYLEAKTGKQIEIGHLGVTWFPLSLRLDDFESRNPQPFPSGYFVKSKRVDAAIDASALLHREFVIKSLVLRQPIINAVSDPDGLWNFENPPSKTTRKQAPIFALGVIPQVEIVGGEVLGSSLIEPNDRPGPIVFEARDVFALLRQVDFNAFADLSSEKSSSALVASGEMKADSVRFGSIRVTDVRSKLRLLTKKISFQDVSMEADRGRATGELSFDLSGTTAHFSANLTVRGLDVAHLLTSFPEGRGKMSGIMEGQVNLGGAIEHNTTPLEGIRGTGKLTVHDGELPSLASNYKLKQMARFRDDKDATRNPAAFSSFSSDINLADQRISSRQMNIAFYGVDVECTGMLGLLNGGTLDYQGVAKVMKRQGFFTNTFAKLLHDAKEENGRLLFPIRVKGTMLSPEFSMN
jgi:uncharacterized protein YhdP